VLFDCTIVLDLQTVLFCSLNYIATPPSIGGGHQRYGQLCSPLTAAEWMLVPCGE
jgi:hypothetical protein